MAQDMRELGRLGGLANGKKKYSEVQKSMDRIFKTKITPDTELTDILAVAGVTPNEDGVVNNLDAVLGVLDALAIKGNMEAIKFIFHLRGVTPEAREKLAKAEATLKIAEDPTGVKVRELVPVSTDALRAEALALGVYAQ